MHGARQEEVIDHRLTDREWAEEWKHLDNVRTRAAAAFNITFIHIFILKQWKSEKLRGHGAVKVGFGAKDGVQMTGTGRADRQSGLCPG